MNQPPSTPAPPDQPQDSADHLLARREPASPDGPQQRVFALHLPPQASHGAAT